MSFKPNLSSEEQPCLCVQGKLVVKAAARAVSAQDDRMLAETLEKLENDNKEVSDRWVIDCGSWGKY